jgi:hypothetical protein
MPFTLVRWVGQVISKWTLRENFDGYRLPDAPAG